MSRMGAVLVRPMTERLSRRVAVALVLGLGGLLILGRLASGQLSDHVPQAVFVVPTAKPANANGLPPQLMMHDREAPASASMQMEAQSIQAWMNYLNAHPEARVNLSVSASSGSATEDSRRIASLVQLFSAGGIDPHRVRVIGRPLFDGETENALGKAASLSGIVAVEIRLE